MAPRGTEPPVSPVLAPCGTHTQSQSTRACAVPGHAWKRHLWAATPLPQVALQSRIWGSRRGRSHLQGVNGLLDCPGSGDGERLPASQPCPALPHPEFNVCCTDWGCFGTRGLRRGDYGEASGQSFSWVNATTYRWRQVDPSQPIVWPWEQQTRRSTNATPRVAFDFFVPHPRLWCSTLPLGPHLFSNR